MYEDGRAGRIPTRAVSCSLLICTAVETRRVPQRVKRQSEDRSSPFTFIYLRTVQYAYQSKINHRRRRLTGRLWPMTTDMSRGSPTLLLREPRILLHLLSGYIPCLPGVISLQQNGAKWTFGIRLLRKLHHRFGYTLLTLPTLPLHDTTSALTARFRSGAPAMSVPVIGCVARTAAAVAYTLPHITKALLLYVYAL